MSVLYQAPLITNLNMETLKSKYYCVLLLLLKKKMGLLMPLGLVLVKSMVNKLHTLLRLLHNLFLLILIIHC